MYSELSANSDSVGNSTDLHAVEYVLHGETIPHIAIFVNGLMGTAKGFIIGGIGLSVMI